MSLKIHFLFMCTIVNAWSGLRKRCEANLFVFLFHMRKKACWKVKTSSLKVLTRMMISSHVFEWMISWPLITFTGQILYRAWKRRLLPATKNYQLLTKIGQSPQYCWADTAQRYQRWHAKVKEWIIETATYLRDIVLMAKAVCKMSKIAEARTSKLSNFT